MQTRHETNVPPDTADRGSSGMLLSAKEITKSFSGVPALRDGRLNLRAGSIHALCGGNGAGKSTFLNIITGILRKDSGTIMYKGIERDFHVPKESLERRYLNYHPGIESGPGHDCRGEPVSRSPAGAVWAD